MAPLTPLQKKQICLGSAADEAVQVHLDLIDLTLNKVSEGTFGVCEICQGQVETDLLQMDYTCCVCIDDYSAEEIRTLEFELELAQKVQRSLLPQQAPATLALDVAAFSRPAQYISGDFFDFIEFKDGTQGLVIADVEGHGISASLNMASVQALMRSLAPTSDSPLHVIQQLNRLLNHNVRFPTFVTMFLGSFDSKTHMLTYCNVGHQPPLILPSDSTNGTSIRWLRPTGAAIGLVEGLEFHAGSILLSIGDIMVLYTDGITEAENDYGQEFGYERLAEVVLSTAKSSVKEIVEAILCAVESFSNGKPLADDTTILACKVVS